jgi:hypothetical protein
MNNFMGYGAGYSLKTGSTNIFIGQYAGYDMTSGHDNNFIGYAAGYSNITGTNNTFIGHGAGYKTSDGYQNIFIGDYAGYQNQGGHGNVFIGNEAGKLMQGSNKLIIQNSTSAYLIYGDFSTSRVGINNASPGYAFVVGTNASPAYCDGGAWVDGSSRAAKENIVALTSTEALQAFAKLEPVKFNYKQDKEEPRLGFIAEDVPELVAEKGRKGLSPMDMVAVLTKVVQEQQKTLQEQQKTFQEQLKEQQEEISELKEKIVKLERYN